MIKRMANRWGVALPYLVKLLIPLQAFPIGIRCNGQMELVGVAIDGMLFYEAGIMTNEDVAVDTLRFDWGSFAFWDIRFPAPVASGF